VSFKRKRRFFSAAPENELADAGADRIERDHRLAAFGQIFVQILHDQNFSPFERFVFNGRDDRADDACKLHYSLASLDGLLSLFISSCRISSINFKSFGSSNSCERRADSA